MVLLGLVFALQGSVVDDARLKGLTDFDSSLQQITDFSATVTKLSGVEFSVPKNVQDLKIDVFVDKKSIGETLDKVAKVLNCDWVAEDKGYRLEMSAENAKKEQDFLAADDAEDRRRLNLRMWSTEYLARQIPGENRVVEAFQRGIGKEVLQQALIPLRKQLTDALKAKDTTEINVLKEKIDMVTALAGEPQYLGIGRILSQMSEPEKKQLVEGDIVAGATFAGARYRLWPSDNPYASLGASLDSNGTIIEGRADVVAWLRFDSWVQCLFVSTSSYELQGQGMGGSSRFPLVTAISGVYPSLKSTPFYRDLEPWLLESRVWTNFKRAINIHTKTWPCPWKGGEFRIGDNLRWLHLASGVPIVARADRRTIRKWKSLDQPYDNVEEYVRSLVQECRAYCLADKDYLLVRGPKYWKIRTHEAPESTWKALETGATPTSFEKLAEVTRLLKRNQLAYDWAWGPVSTIDRESLTGIYSSTQFYDQFSVQQKRAMGQPSGLSYSDFSSSQKKAFLFLLKYLASDGSSWSLEVAKALATNSLTTTDLDAMSIHVSAKDIPEHTEQSFKTVDNETDFTHPIETPMPAVLFTFEVRLGDSFPFISNQVFFKK